MNTIPLHRQIAHARDEFAATIALAASRRRGCREARRQLQRAERYGLDKRPYAIVRRDGEMILAGWCGAGIGPLRTVSEGGAA